ncbi:hypothetical protein P389DRAFT_212743 [Cystobasidium minutum MCA 4210]|uniref:uncharacterized protein n=1 Tax=Cystobasidium minutum MCA 4210 TaxID=1397322 RepID=UPI0034CEAF60|eukprot:jgi/Rhomi1/212743/estExt_Genemark1.C_70261
MEAKTARWRRRSSCTCTRLSSLRNSFISLLYATAYLSPVALAQRDITIYANDPVLRYTPPEAWVTATGQSLGDGSARITRWSGAKVSLTFEGTAIYFQTARGKGRGVSRIELDQAKFQLDSSSHGKDENVGVLWGIVSLNDTRHTITVTQTAEDGVELAINTFIYTTTSKDAVQKPLLPPPPKAPPGFLDPENEQFKRNVGLVSTSGALFAILILILLFIARTYPISRKGISKTSIRLALSPRRSSRSDSTTHDMTPVPWKSAASTLQTPTSAAFLLKTSAAHVRDELWPVNRTISLSSLVSYASQEAQVQARQEGHHAKLQQVHQKRPRFTLPSIPIYSREPSFNASTMTPNTGASSPMFPVGRASSELEHDSCIPPVPDIPLSIRGHTEEGRAANVQHQGVGIDDSARTSAPRSLSLASNFSMTFSPTVLALARLASPPPAYNDDSASLGAASPSAGRRRAGG